MLCVNFSFCYARVSSYAVNFTTACTGVLGIWVANPKLRMCFPVLGPVALYLCFENSFWTVRIVQSLFLIPSPYAWYGRTVLRFPTNSHRLSTVELLCTRHGNKGSLIHRFSRSLNRQLCHPFWAPIRAMTVTAEVIRLCTCIRYWPYRGVETCASEHNLILH